MKQAIIFMLFNIVGTVVIDIYNVYETNKRLRKLEEELPKLKFETNKRLTSLESEE